MSTDIDWMDCSKLKQDGCYDECVLCDQKYCPKYDHLDKNVTHETHETHETKLIEIPADTNYLGEFVNDLLVRYNTVSIQKSIGYYILKLER